MGVLKRLTTNATLRQKLTAIIMLISLIVLLLASGSFILAKVISYRQDTLKKLNSISGILGTNLAPAIVLNDKHVMHQTLASLANEPQIVAAYLFSREGNPLAKYINKETTEKLSTEKIYLNQNEALAAIRNNTPPNFDHSNLLYYAPINGNQGVIGVIGLQASMSGLYHFIYQFIGSFFLVLMLIVLIAFLLASRLQRIVSKPITTLANAINSISENDDFTARAEIESHDEIGSLIEGFNNMLEQLQVRDEQLKDYQQNLESLVLQRTRELQNSNTELQQAIRELKQAKITAEQANKAKSQFLAKMSHEIRTPMIGILGMAEQLTNADLPENEQCLVQTVHRSGELLLGILDDVLDFSKIEAGKLDLENIIFSMRSICEEVISIFTKQADEKSLKLSYHIDDECSGNFLGDPFRIKQILTNLISNAVKFTREGEVVLTVNPSGKNQDKTIWLAVTDTGIGIEKSVQDEIFKSFSQADNTMTRKFGGSGLGLSIVRQLTHLMGGTCGLQSTEGKGSTFWVVLDLHAAEENEATNNDKGSTPQIATTLSNANILLVEDNKTTQQLLSLILGKTGCKLDIMTNGLHAIDLLEKSEYDLIFMDCEMPGMDGFEATRLLREKNCQTPIVALTAHVGKEDMAKCLESGMNDCLNKPFRQKQLLDKIEKWLPLHTGAANEI